ncbi:hypothetical protein [Xenorhabdus innexi]|uniref:Gluconate permease n=1 Tax=Xenorhabdus innexi TaxID=290109 RepID=A0A1N6MTK3_9GAMM|nr:hypothetical protein [Xenorhabdus innexi]PHM36789.1 gluconate permease [Xenorhabdus innexi]SIP72147.1 hypothetical protein XIS1_1370003 [Xenorhabdus innexi]
MIGLKISIFTLFFLILCTRIHVLIVMLVSTIITGGLTIARTVSVIGKGFGSTLGSTGIVINHSGAHIERFSFCKFSKYSPVTLINTSIFDKSALTLLVTKALSGIPCTFIANNTD